MINRLDSSQPEFQEVLRNLLNHGAVASTEVSAVVAGIIAEVEANKDEAVLAFSRQYDQLHAVDMSELVVDADELQAALQQIPKEQRIALEAAAKRIRAYHQRQVMNPWQFEDEYGSRLGQRVNPLQRVGIYVPGGKASYPSSVLMNAIPAQVAGVDEIVMVTPTPGGERNKLVLAAAALAGINRVFTIGGAQAIAALAVGTETIPRVDKIVGPGNVYVAAAKQQVFGRVGIDMVAGPSEILIICDGHTPPEWVVMDLFAQAEHDEDAQAILLCPDAAYLDAVQEQIGSSLERMERCEIIAASLARRGALIQVRDLHDAVQISNQVAPEHLELSVADPEALLADVRHAGAVFMGRYTAEALGDYCAGPSHVLPTSGSARFSSPLSVYDFQTRSSVIHCSKEGASALGKIAGPLARGESLTAHALSAECRIIRGDVTGEVD